MDGGNVLCLVYAVIPVRIITFIPLIVCVILLRLRSDTENCTEFMNYYDLCSIDYGDDFINSFSNIMKITTYTLWVVILFGVEIFYHLIVALCIGCE